MTSTAGRLAPVPHLLGLMEDQLDRLRGAGFADRDAALITYVQGFVLQEQAPLAADQADGVPRTAVAETAADRFRSLPQDTPHFVALADHLTLPTMEERFRFGVERLLDGMSALLADQHRGRLGGDEEDLQTSTSAGRGR